MRIIIGAVLLALGACSSEGEPKREAAAAEPAAAPGAPAAPASAPALPAAPVQASMMAIPSDPGALARLEAMGYTVHREEGHLHAPGVKGCPAMTDNPVM